MTERFDRATLVGLGLARRRDGHLLAVEPHLRGRPRRLLLPRRRLPERPDVDRVLGRRERHHRVRRARVRAVRAVPGDRLPAARCGCRAGHRGPVRDRHQRAAGGAVVGMGWWLLGRLSVRSLVDRFWLVLLLGFSTQIWWITTRGGVWHTGQLIATLLTLALPDRAWREPPGVADRPAGRSGVPVTGAARNGHPVLRAAPRRRHDLGAAQVAVGVVAEAGRRRPAGRALLLLVQRGAVRVTVRVGLRPGDGAAVARGAAPARVCSRPPTSR